MRSLGFKSLTCVIRSFCTGKLVLWWHLQRHCLSNRNRVNFKLGWPAHELGVGCHDFDFWISVVRDKWYIWSSATNPLINGYFVYLGPISSILGGHLAFEGVTATCNHPSAVCSEGLRFHVYSLTKIKNSCPFPPFWVWVVDNEGSNGEITPAKEAPRCSIFSSRIQ